MRSLLFRSSSAVSGRSETSGLLGGAAAGEAATGVLSTLVATEDGADAEEAEFDIFVARMVFNRLWKSSFEAPGVIYACSMPFL
jgi:hypothetical protein